MQLLSQLNKIDRFDASWTSIEKLEGGTLKQLKTVATVRSVGSSTRIEGSEMTNAEVEKLIDQLKVAKLEERDEQEVAGYFEALDTISEHYADIQISENHIKNLHKILMQFSQKDEWHRGDYKQHSNSVDETHPDGSRRTLFETAAPGYETEDAMRQLIEWFNSDKDTIPIVKIALFVYDFLSIHPFQDGNGRLSRLLGTLLLLKHGYTWIQYISFEHEIEHRKAEYYKVLMHTQKQRPGENVSDWLYFFTNCMLNIENQLEEKLKTKQTQSYLSNKEQNILAFLDAHSGSKSSDIAVKLNIPLPTVKKILSALTQNKVISKRGIGKGTTYQNEISRQIKKDVQFCLNNQNKTQEFILTNMTQSIDIKKIILQPNFNWTSAGEWSQKVVKLNLGFTISGFNSRGGHFGCPFSIVSKISPYLYQPVFELEPKINIPLSIIDIQPNQSEFPVKIKIELTATGQNNDFDVFFVYDALI